MSRARSAIFSIVWFSILSCVATVDMAGNRLGVSLALLADAHVGDYVMVHAGFAIATWAPEDAAVTLRLLAGLRSASPDASPQWRPRHDD